MATGDRVFGRIPPDSTGKGLLMGNVAQIKYISKTGGYAWKIGREYSLGDGMTLVVYKENATTASTGDLEVIFSDAAVYAGTQPTLGTTIIDPDSALDIANVDSFIDDLYITKSSIVSGDNPDRALTIDAQGSANIRFGEGKPQLDAFGKLRTSGATILGDYTFMNSIPSSCSQIVTSGATVTHDNTAKTVVLTNPTTTGAVSTLTSNVYHHYVPGSSHLAMVAGYLGDSGKTNLTRQWGLFDDQDGFFFQQRNGVFECVVRSSVTGSVEEIIVPQSAFSADQINGDLNETTNSSGMDIDLTLDNLYWIDVQWLGAGRIRFGTFYQGERITIHEYQHGNTVPKALARRASLPVTFKQINTGTTGSSSEARFVCAGVQTEMDINLKDLGTVYGTEVEVVLTDTSETYIGSIGPAETYTNSSEINRTLILGDKIDIMAFDSGGNPAGVSITAILEPVLGNTDFLSTGELSQMSVDEDANYYGGGIQKFTTNAYGHSDTELKIATKVTNYGGGGSTATATIAGVTQATTAVVTISEAIWPLREGYPLVISTVVGMTELNAQTVYIKPTGLQTAELYSDVGLTTPINSSGYGVYTSGGNILGQFGDQGRLAFVATKRSGTGNVSVYATITWLELSQ
jgi:hypothetical protein